MPRDATDPAHRLSADSPRVGSAADLRTPIGAPTSYAANLDVVEAQLASAGAMAVLLVDASDLEAIEQGYGREAYRGALGALSALVEEVVGPELQAGEWIATGDPGSHELLVLLFRPRSADDFYRSGLLELAVSLGDRIAKQGAHVVYPYRREAPSLPLGTSFALHNPGLRVERQLRDMLSQARTDAELNRRIEARARARRFEDVVLAEEVTILYEPIVNLTSLEVLGYEALVRGPADSNLHTPKALFDLAEETGLVFELDCLCRRAALRGARGLPPGKRLFLNVLPTAIHDPAFRGDALRATLDGLRLRPSDVVFEISEGESIDNFEIFREACDYYAGLGFRIALDDIGVAYGSLHAVMELSPDFIKADLSLVRSIDTEEPRRELLRALHAVAGKLQCQLVAEGIETREELSTLQAIGVPLGQGYLLGRPAPLRRSV